eukprot:353077-Chlamydomonas_euryale.AAC.4
MEWGMQVHAVVESLCLRLQAASQSYHGSNYKQLHVKEGTPHSQRLDHITWLTYHIAWLPCRASPMCQCSLAATAARTGCAADATIMILPRAQRPRPWSNQRLRAIPGCSGGCANAAHVPASARLAGQGTINPSRLWAGQRVQNPAAAAGATAKLPAAKPACAERPAPSRSFPRARQTHSFKSSRQVIVSPISGILFVWACEPDGAGRCVGHARLLEGCMAAPSGGARACDGMLLLLRKVCGCHRLFAARHGAGSRVGQPRQLCVRRRAFSATASCCRQPLHARGLDGVARDTQPATGASALACAFLMTIQRAAGLLSSLATSLACRTERCAGDGAARCFLPSAGGRSAGSVRLARQHGAARTSASGASGAQDPRNAERTLVFRDPPRNSTAGARASGGRGESCWRRSVGGAGDEPHARSPPTLRLK